MENKVKVPLLNSKGNLRFIEIKVEKVNQIEKSISTGSLTSRYYVSTNAELTFEQLERRVLYASLEEALRRSYRGNTVDNNGRVYVVYVVGVSEGVLGILGCYDLNTLGFLTDENIEVVQGTEEVVLSGASESKDDVKQFPAGAQLMTEVKDNRGFVDTLTYYRDGALKFDVLDAPLQLSDKELQEEYIKFQKIQGVLKDTSAVVREKRKHLDFVTDASDVYVDKELYDKDVVDSVTNVVSQGFLPYQYQKSGDMVLNPKGGVLVCDLGAFGVSGLENYTDKYVSVISAVLLGLLLQGKEKYEYNWGAVAMVALTRGLDNNVLYPFVKKDAYEVGDFSKVCSCSSEVLYREFRHTLEGAPVSSVEILGLVISTIIDGDLFETSKLGFPSLRDMVSRIELARLIEGV